LLAAAAGRVGLNHDGAERRQTAGHRAERIVKDELEVLGWQEADLQIRPKGHQGKVKKARRLQTERTISLKCIAQRLHMGSWTYVSNLLTEQRHCPAAQAMLPLCQ
jgi:hypothetical protein